MTFYQKWKIYQYYVIIGVISLVALFFLPMIGSTAGLAWNLPTTTVGWIVYTVSKLLVATINILIFHCFVKQGKVNVRDNEKYLQACQIMSQQEDKQYIPRAPKQYFKQVYGKKSIVVFMTTVLSAIGLTQAILTFDLISMLTYFFTILMGVIFGILQMNEVETFWTQEYWLYAKRALKEAQQQRQLDSNTDCGANLLDTGICAGDSGVIDRPMVVCDNECSDSVLGSAGDACDSIADCLNSSNIENN